jgi:hypothetical protein
MKGSGGLATIMDRHYNLLKDISLATSPPLIQI